MTLPTSRELRERVERVRRAFLDEGAYPPYHRRKLEQLSREWPTLYNAIMGLLNEPRKETHANHRNPTR